MTKPEPTVPFELQRAMWLQECRSQWEVAAKHFGIDIPINPEIWSYLPWGHRVVVLQVPEEEITAGGILIPEDARQQNNVGWVLTVGMQICEPDPVRYSSVCPFDYPLDLVGRKVNYGMFAGIELRFHAIDLEFDARHKGKYRYKQLLIGDVHGEILMEMKDDEASKWAGTAGPPGGSDTAVQAS